MVDKLRSHYNKKIKAGWGGIPCGSAGKESACNAGDLGSIPGSGRFPGQGKGYTLQYSGLENSMDCIVHGGLKESDTTEQPSFLMKMKVKVKSLSLSDSLQSTRFLHPWDFSRQEYWSGLSFPSPRELPDPGIEPGSPTL